MKQVPEIISTKDLAYLEDMFNWNITACKKAYNYSKSISDKKIKNHLEKISKYHEDVTKKIINIFAKENE